METTKKQYCQPSLKVVMINSADLIATSNVSLRFSPESEEEGYAD